MGLGSIIFLYGFCPAFFLIYYLLPKRFRNAALLLFSLAFYAWGDPYCICVLIASAAVNFLLGRLLSGDRSARTRKCIFAAGCCFNILLLGVFKYTGFIFRTVCSALGIERTAPVLPLPMGISFYTFQAVSFLADAYRRRIKAGPVGFSLYMMMFPRVMQGPLMRYEDLAPQLDARTVDAERVAGGIFRFVIGLAKKVLIADVLGTVSAGLGAVPDTVAGAWLGLAAYTLQLYFDFSGYTDMALGLGGMMGFTFPENFRYPYCSRSISDFWRRWHITLGAWFRDYVYFPLGGSRTTKPKLVRNLLIVWLLTGLWHGAGWTFVIWGLFHGVVICIEKLAGLEKRKIPSGVRHIVCMFLVMFGWVPFRSAGVGEMSAYFARMFGAGAVGAVDSTALLYLHDYLPLILIAAVGCTPLVSKLCSRLGEKRPALAGALRCAATVLLLLLCTVFLVNSTYQPQLYARF